MIISLNWLNTYLDSPVGADEAERVLTDIGFPLDDRDVRDAGEAILDVEVTSNRPDCLCHVGIARELAAATGRRLLGPEVNAAESPDDVQTQVQLTNDAPDLCPQYTARVVRGVRVGPSPRWLAERLEAIGLRPVNNVVDATNFVLHELGQPLHAFDLDRLAGRKVVVRRAANAEPFTAIDASRHKLAAGMLVIADGDSPVALAGIMGGLESEVTDRTTDILLESARFDPLSVRTTSRALKLASDSSYRFERGVDPQGLALASQRAARLILDLAGGTLCAGVLTAGQPLPEARRLTLRPERCCMLLGLELDTAGMVERLEALGLQPVERSGGIECTIPSHRLDLEREADLIEEVARLHGYDHIPVHERMHIVARPPQRFVEARKTVGRVLVAHGYHETITFSTIARRHAEAFAEPHDASEPVMISDERAAEPMLRPSLLPSLLNVRKTNQDAGNRDVKLFEVARTFGRKDGAYREISELGLLADAADANSVRDLRSTLEELCESLGWEQLQWRPAPAPCPSWASAAGLIVDPDDGPGRVIGTFGRAADATLKHFDLNGPVDLAQLDYDRLIEAYPPRRRVSELLRFPGIERDLSVIVDETTTWQSIADAIDRAEPALLQSVQFVDTYRGRQVGPGRKSLTFTLRFADPERTLRHDEVDAQVRAVVDRLKQSVNAELRA